jgi:energy-converting hydrogenase B subunit C
LWDFVIEIIRSIFLITASILIIATAYGILKLDSRMDNVLYARIHMLGMFDIACVLALIGLSQIFVAGIYFIIAPFIAHAIAHAYYHGEDGKKNGNGSERFITENTLDDEKTNDKIMEDTHD